MIGVPNCNFWNEVWASCQPLVVFAFGVIGVLIFSIIVLLLLRVIGRIIGKDIINILFR